MRQGERPGIGASGAGLSDAHGDTSMKPLPRKVRGALVVLEVGLAALIGVAAGLGALLCAATITARPPLFVLTGLIAFCATYLLGLWLATRKVDAFRKRRVRVALFCAGTVLVAGTFAWTALLPMGDPRLRRRCGARRQPGPPVGHEGVQRGLPARPRGTGDPHPRRKGALRLPLVVLGGGVLGGLAQRPAPVPGGLRAQRLPGRAQALHGELAGVPARPAPARGCLQGTPYARRLRGTILGGFISCGYGMARRSLQSTARIRPPDSGGPEVRPRRIEDKETPMMTKTLKAMDEGSRFPRVKLVVPLPARLPVRYLATQLRQRRASGNSPARLASNSVSTDKGG